MDNKHKPTAIDTRSQPSIPNFYYVQSTSEIRQFSKNLSPPKIILQKHRQKLSNWDSFIANQQKELETKKDSLQSLEIKLAKIALNNINDKCEKVNQWESAKRQQFEKQKRRIELRTQRLDQQQLELGNQRISMEMKYKTKLLKLEQQKKLITQQQNDIDSQKIRLKSRENDLVKKEKILKADQERMDNEYKEYQDLKNELIKKQQKIDDMEKEFRQKIKDINHDKHDYIEFENKLKMKEQEYMRYINENDKRLLQFHEKQKIFEKERESVLLKERDIMEKERVLSESIMNFQNEMNQREELLKIKEIELENKDKELNDKSARLELWSNELRDFEHGLEKKRLDLIEQKNRITHLFDSFGASKL